MVKNPPAMQVLWVQSLGREDPLEEEMATHSSILAWETPWTEESGGLQSMGSLKSWTTTDRLNNSRNNKSHPRTHTEGDKVGPGGVSAPPKCGGICSQRVGGRGLQVDRHPLGGSSHALGKPPGSLEAFWLMDLGNLKIPGGW